MALIKGSKTNKAGVVVVQGDQVIAEETRPPARGRSRSAGETRAPGPHGDMTDPFDAEPAVRPAAGDPEPTAPAWEREATVEPGPAPPPERAVPRISESQEGEDSVARWDQGRDALLEGVRAQGELAAEGAAGDASAADLYDQLYLETAERVVAALGDGSEAEQAMDAVIPAIERQAAAQAELAAAAAAARARWRELAGAEEQIAALLANFDFPEGSRQQILAEREQLLAAARLEAARILAEAQEEAARFRADAENQGAQALEDFELTRQERFEQLREEARAAGYTEGRAQADEEGARIIEEAIETLNRARLSYPRAVRENQDKLIDLALQVAEKIIGEEITSRPDTVLSTLDAALDRVTDLESVTVRVHPDDLPIVQEQEEKYRDMLAQVKKLEFVGSQKIQRGGVFIETSSGTVDATIKTQLSVVSEVFRGVKAELDGGDETEAEAFRELDEAP